MDWIPTSTRKSVSRSSFEFQHPEETLILANEKHLVIAGRDRWNPTRTEAKGRLAMKTDIQQEYGTANAVFTFLQEDLGVRWLWPPKRTLSSENASPFRPWSGDFISISCAGRDVCQAFVG